MATDWAKLLQDLLVKKTTGLQDILDQENLLRLNTQRGLFDRGKEKEAALVDVGVNAADRGMLNSGIALNDVAQTGNVYATLMDRIKEDETNGLARLARSRLGIENAYSSGELDIRKQKADEEAADALARQKAADEAALQAATNAAAVPSIPGAGSGSGGGGSWGVGSPAGDTRTKEQYDRDLANWYAAASRKASDPNPRAYAYGPPPKKDYQAIYGPQKKTTPNRPLVGRY